MTFFCESSTLSLYYVNILFISFRIHIRDRNGRTRTTFANVSAKSETISRQYTAYCQLALDGYISCEWETPDRRRNVFRYRLLLSVKRSRYNFTNTADRALIESSYSQQPTKNIWGSEISRWDVSLAANHFILLLTRITIPIQVVFNGIYYWAGIT